MKSLYLSFYDITGTEEITFSPYSSPKEMTSLFVYGKIKVYGTAVVTEYLNDHLSEITKNCYFSVNIDYPGAQPTVSFHQYNENGHISNTEDTNIVTIQSENSFVMRHYVTPEMNNKTYIKQ